MNIVNKNICFVKKSLLIATLVVFISMFGCATQGENTALENARTLYEQAQATPEITENAPVALYEAARDLQKAEKARDVEEKEHLAYLSEKKIEIAIALAEQRKAEKEIEQLSEQKNQILLETRAYEVEQSRKLAELRAKEAEAKALELERKKAEAEALARRAEKAKSEVEAKSLELEKARKESEAKALQVEMARIQAEQALIEKQQLEMELTELQAELTERGAVLTLGDVLFEVNNDILMPGAMRTINKLADFLKKYPARNILIEGHTDSTGSKTYNFKLSQRRADSVRKALLSLGIGQERITTKGYGEQYPVASNATRAGRQQNRRVEIVILEEGVNRKKMEIIISE